MIINYTTCWLFSKLIKRLHSCQIREFTNSIRTIAGVFLIASVVTADCRAADAQQTGKIPRIGVLVSARPSSASQRIQAFQQGLRELGYVEGKNIFIEYRYAEGKVETVPELTDELVRLKVDIIVTDTSNATEAAKNATKTIPVVFTLANDPVGDGQVASLARPGGNLTGFSLLAPELNAKRLELLKEVAPKATRISPDWVQQPESNVSRKPRPTPKDWGCDCNSLGRKALTISRAHSTPQNGQALKLSWCTQVLLRLLTAPGLSS
jgi:ABC transporter substrate binding protein